MTRSLGLVVRDAEANALYLYIRAMPAERDQANVDDSASTTVARTVELASFTTVLADFSADHRLLGIEVLFPAHLRPLYLYRQAHSPRQPRPPHPHRPHHVAPAGPGSRREGVAGAWRAGERLRSARVLRKVVRWWRGHTPT